jgi:hypothetical protein
MRQPFSGLGETEQELLSGRIFSLGFGATGRGKIFLYSTQSIPALGPNQPPIQWVSGALSPGVKRMGREGDRSPPSSAEVKNGGAIPLLPP